MELAHMVWVLLVLAYAGYAVSVAGARRADDRSADTAPSSTPRLRGAGPADVGAPGDDRFEDAATLRRAA
ncbi:hypothetical protein KZX45_06840 [Georgenia sp. EYE_87]|uniref:hypothetical protein n=1 Tax=Georgenia sp. EYE_87 TaxID=2853448 RepID=UPI0020066FFC|nr:hypothetical protein [Georgenia sp. EYE_87]MCK6210260.1 hypothetical protein [Georgenia sp. EYE_87]